MAKRSGLQYRIDRFVQGIAPLRAVDVWALKHPVIDAACYPLLAVIMGFLAGFSWHSVALGVVVGVAAVVFLPLLALRNRRRRRANGTSPEYGPPS